MKKLLLLPILAVILYGGYIYSQFTPFNKSDWQFRRNVFEVAVGEKDLIPKYFGIYYMNHYLLNDKEYQGEILSILANIVDSDRTFPLFMDSLGIALQNGFDINAPINITTFSYTNPFEKTERNSIIVDAFSTGNCPVFKKMLSLGADLTPIFPDTHGKIPPQPELNQIFEKKYPYAAKYKGRNERRECIIKSLEE